MKQQVELLDGRQVNVEYQFNKHGSFDIDSVTNLDRTPAQVTDDDLNGIMDELLSHLNPQTGLPDDPEGREREYRSRRNRALGLESHVEPLAKKLLQSLLSS